MEVAKIQQLRLDIAPPPEEAYGDSGQFEPWPVYPNTEVVGGRHTYGEALGIVVTHKYKARIRGDVGNAETFDFPVRYAVVPEFDGIAHRRADPGLIEPFVRAVRSLEEVGVRAVTTSCGFLAFYQDVVASSVGIPVFTSSLLLVPLVYRMAGRKGDVCVVTGKGRHLDERFFEAVGASDIPVLVAGMEEQPEFRRAVIDDGPGLNPHRMAVEMVHVARGML